jgi:hypothetical protein
MKNFYIISLVVTMTAISQSVAISDDGSVADGSAYFRGKNPQLRDSYYHV